MLLKFGIKGPLTNISSTFFFFFFDLPLKLRVVYLRNKQTNSVINIEFYKHVHYCFCCYVIKSAGEAANKVLLSIVWNPLLIEINLSQIRTLDIKREKVCAVCPYLSFSKRNNEVRNNTYRVSQIHVEYTLLETSFLSNEMKQ